MELFIHLSSVLNQNFLSFLEGNGDLTEVKHVSVGNQGTLDGGSADLQVKNLGVILAARFSAFKMDGKEPFVMLSALRLILGVKVEYLSTHSFKYSISVEAVL